MAIPYQTAKFNIFAMAIWGPTAKFNFRLYSILSRSLYLLLHLIAATSPEAFSDALSATDLVFWLSQKFKEKNLTWDPSVGQKMIG